MARVSAPDTRFRAGLDRLPVLDQVHRRVGIGGECAAIIAFAVRHFIGPPVLGRPVETLGRRVMITETYILSGVMIAISGWMFHTGMVTALTQTAAWCVIFFFASAAVSAAYLTVSEIFSARGACHGRRRVLRHGPELRGSRSRTVLYGALIGDGSNPTAPMFGYLLAAAVLT